MTRCSFRSWLPLLLLPVTAVHAQHGAYGIRFASLEFNKFIKTHSKPPMGFALAFDHDLGANLAMSFEGGMLWRSFHKSVFDGQGDEIYYQGWMAEQVNDLQSPYFTYRAAYFPGGNADGGFYVGSYIGIRRITNTVQILSQSEEYFTSGTSPTPPFLHQQYNAAATVFPVGLRAGFRSSMEDVLYADVYFGVGYQFGSGAAFFEEPELVDMRAPLTHVTWTIGFSFGYGWGG